MFERLTPVIQQAAAVGIKVPVLPDFPAIEPLNGQQPATPTLPIPQVPGPPLPAVSPIPPPPAAAPQPISAPASAQRELHMDASGRVLVSPNGAAPVLLINAGTTLVHASPAVATDADNGGGDRNEARSRTPLDEAQRRLAAQTVPPRVARGGGKPRKRASPARALEHDFQAETVKEEFAAKRLLT